MNKFIFFSFSLFALTSLNAQTWNESQKGVASDRSASDYYGWAVAIADRHAAVGAHETIETLGTGVEADGVGAVYIFGKSPSSSAWLETEKLTASDAAEGDFFGYAVDIEGKHLISGASHEDEDADGSNNSFQCRIGLYFRKRWERSMAGNPKAGAIGSSGRKLFWNGSSIGPDFCFGRSSLS